MGKWAQVIPVNYSKSTYESDEGYFFEKEVGHSAAGCFHALGDDSFDGR